MDYKWPKIIVTTLHMVSCVPSLNLGCFALQNLTEHGRSDAIPAYKGLTASNTHSWNPDKEATLTVSPNKYRERHQPVFSVLSNSPEHNVSEAILAMLAYLPSDCSHMSDPK